jgi:hypothetical protein
MFGWLRRDPKPLIDARQLMAHALADYPVYEPPHRQGPAYLRRRPSQTEEEYGVLFSDFVERGRENFHHLMAHRDERMSALSTFLAKFGMEMGFDDAGLAAVSAWCPGNCGALVANLRDEAVSQAFLSMRRPWTEQWRGLNFIFDLGFFLGECLIVRNPRLHWVYLPGMSDDGSSNRSGYAIDGFKRAAKGNWLDPIAFVYSECGNDELHLRTGQPMWRLKADWLVGKVRDFSTR